MEPAGIEPATSCLQSGHWGCSLFATRCRWPQTRRFRRGPAVADGNDDRRNGVGTGRSEVGGRRRCRTCSDRSRHADSPKAAAQGKTQAATTEDLLVREAGPDPFGWSGPAFAFRRAVNLCQRACRLGRGMIARIVRTTSDAAPIRNAYQAMLLTVPGCFAFL